MWLPGNCVADIVTLTLAWDPSQVTANNPAAVSYRLYMAIGSGSFNLTTTVQATPTPTVQVAGVDTSVQTRFFVTGVGANGNESGQSNTLTNAPTVVPPPTGVIGISTPILTATNLVRGATITGTARFTNGTTATVQVNQGWLTARQPGASNQSGPFDDWSPGIPSQAVNPGQIVTLTASWVVRADAPFGTWQVHLAVQVGGVYNDGPTTPFNVVTNVPPPTQPPLPPSNLRIVPVTSTRVDLFWTNGDSQARTEVEERKEQDAFKRIVTVSAGTATYVRTNLRRKNDYAYRIRATKNGLVSDYSNVVLRPAM